MGIRRFGIVTIFPEMFNALNASITGKAQENEIIKIQCWNPRDFTTDRHKMVDDRPYGGGPGMVMKPEPICKAITAAKEHNSSKAKVIQLTPEGKTFTQEVAKELAQRDGFILVAGRYEGIDERVVETAIDEQYSIGDYILTGGELPAMVLIDSVVRLLPGALGDAASAVKESFSEGLLDYPHYTRPREYAGIKIPDVLQSGNHQAIEEWRHQQSLKRTWQKRPDLLKSYQLTDSDKEFLKKLVK